MKTFSQWLENINPDPVSKDEALSFLRQGWMPYRSSYGYSYLMSPDGLSQQNVRHNLSGSLIKAGLIKPDPAAYSFVKGKLPDQILDGVWTIIS